ncbi:hypothetical protein C8R47DRAFT_1064817 [Mycena vitilis]|nr:hypothetical protein C8R47DRAFT_1064817 [Mycena vitilis]
MEKAATIKISERDGSVRVINEGRILNLAATACWFEMRVWGEGPLALPARPPGRKRWGGLAGDREGAAACERLPAASAGSGTGPRGAGAERNGQTALSTHYEKKEGSGGRAEKRGKARSWRGTRTSRKSDGVTFASRSHALSLIAYPTIRLKPLVPHVEAIWE